jgi:PHD/YefM family antitoxin component YafN of YafNO toxin-antitoxin module
MHLIPRTLPISDLRFKQTETLNELETGPVLLTRQGKAVAMLVSPEQWNSLIEVIEDLRLTLGDVQALKENELRSDFRDYLRTRSEQIAAR